MPTILDALSLPMPVGLRGRSLLPAAVGRAKPAPSGTYFEALSGQLNRGWAPLYGLIEGSWKYIDLPIPELYRLDEDPREERNLAEAEPERLADLRDALVPLRAIDPGSVPGPESAEVRERLRALGYLGGGSTDAGGKTFTAEDDPKRLIALDEIQREVAGLYEGRLEESLTHWRAALSADPAEYAKLLAIATNLWKAGKTAPARPLLQVFVNSAPRAVYGEEIRRIQALLATLG